MSTTKVLGIVSMVPMGEWNASTTYQKLNYVRHNNANYLAYGPSLNVEPGISPNWKQYWMFCVYDGGQVVPDGTYPEMTVGNAFYAQVAVKASQDGNGNVIVLTYATKSDLSSEAAQRQSADNALLADINGIMEQLAQTQHFRGYYETTAQIQSLPNPQNGDYAWSAQSGTVWNYDGSWTNSGVDIPDQTVPKSTTTPLMDGTATLGSTNTYADGGHRHPTDTTRASVVDLQNEISAREVADTTLQNNITAETNARTSADTNLQNQIDDIVDGTTVVGQAKRLSNTTAVGSSSKPIYFSANGVPVACGDELDVSVTGGASYLTKNGIVNASATSQVGWWKVFSVPISKLTSISVASTYSVLVEVNGVYDGDEGSGKIEINGRSNASLWAEANCRALSGNLNIQNFAVAVSSNGANLEFYTYTERQFTRLAFTVTSEYYSAAAVNVITWTLNFASTSAPANAVYAVNRNNAAQVENPLTIVAGTVTATYNGSSPVTINVAGEGQTTIQEVSIPTSAWYNNVATITVNGVTTTAYVNTLAADSQSEIQIINSNVRSIGQAANTLIFAADSTPTATININTLIIL